MVKEARPEKMLVPAKVFAPVKAFAAERCAKVEVEIQPGMAPVVRERMVPLVPGGNITQSVPLC